MCTSPSPELFITYKEYASRERKSHGRMEEGRKREVGGGEDRQRREGGDSGEKREV